MLSDSLFEATEESLTDKIAVALDITDDEKSVIKRLMTQRKVVEAEKIF